MRMKEGEGKVPRNRRGQPESESFQSDGGGVPASVTPEKGNVYCL